MVKIKGPFKLKGGESLAKSVRKMVSQEQQNVSLPFSATGWKSDKMPAKITKADIEQGEIKPKKEAE
jgi:hypothetical protein